MQKLKLHELGRKTTEEFKDAEKKPIIVVLDNVRSGNNVGSVFRSADAFLLSGIYLCGITAQPPHKDIHKTAIGATESVMWKHFDSTLKAIKELKRNGYQIISVEQTTGSQSIRDFQPEENKPMAIVFGNEVEGVQQEIIDLSDACIEIPQYGTKHSLNISVCAGVVLYELSA
ncbi:MAG: RNA methyltransferase [Bacteroidia bacterium]|nr:RNA methyltransferase [Bacteroidia bacterium]NNC86362.1 RNA methyltransferase [Bacteroidia bacterium]NNM15604.1 RNA methyltransferase [Bacteroidia bacterium]